ncbi:major intrinsic protein domain-containing protein [Ditylenchus destructor]|uniref:Major intrinsic protein domain-containing protein n=1 Tax=Ditylenchus destructor TaxID=166010 RepID=A0AAD4NKM6_9BILA|nr:major intrinsic protein domain-containing protein [Ditylenchus destructor]
MLEQLRHKLFIRNKLIRGAVGEFFGTFLLVFIGDCIVTQYHLGTACSGLDRNAWININIGWGFAVVFGIFVVSRSSGGHINPAVTLMLYTFGAVDLKTTAVYFVAQTIGAFFGAAATYGFYIDAIDDRGLTLPISAFATRCVAAQQITLDPPDKLKYLQLTAGIFTSFPAQHLSLTGAFVDQAVGTGILCLLIAAIIDKRNEVPAHMHALFFGFVVMMIGCSFGLNVGYPINPARDFGPRLFASIIYGTDVFTVPHSLYFLMPILGPLFGGVAGGWIYYIFSGYQIPDASDARLTKNARQNVNASLEESKPLTSSEDHSHNP